MAGYAIYPRSPAGQRIIMRKSIHLLRFVFLYLSLVAISLAAVKSEAQEIPAKAPPNVVIILSDDQAWTDYGFVGHKQIQTPAIDQLAKESLTFTRGYVPSSLCRPSLMTLITGQYPHQHGISGNDPPKGTDRREMLKHVRRAETLPKLLGKAGYTSFQCGKWWEGNHAEGGFTAGMTHGDPAKGGRHGDVGLKIGREGLQPIADFLDANGEKPFFLWYAPLLPHSPHTPPERLLAKYRDKTESLHIAKYWAMCEWWDESVGELLAMLDKRKLSDNTIVVYLADNGWLQDPASPKYAPRSKRSPNEGGIRTPIMVRWPAKIKPSNSDVAVSSIDLAPTILAACGVAIPADLPGLSLMPENQSKVAAREYLFGEIFEHDVADIDRPAAGLMYRWVLEAGPGDDRYKLIVSADGRASQLYNIARDPTEEKDLATADPERVAKLQKKLDAWWKP
ncbi:Arylsulfatase precursor [Anatilimnocola aggregata]|uniref:Arylsulfatase n=2 Tax=Anatilimnocola aggregata TaxID=2528021 RepID=A0A517YCC6_9BACT|nr:Arylsulfatase precursor [Anatilimnocola aggregata]